MFTCGREIDVLDNFHLAAICHEAGELSLLQLPLHQGLQITLSEQWNEQYVQFLGEIEEIQFDPGYLPEEHERFCLKGFELPPWLEDHDIHSVRDLMSIETRQDVISKIKGLVAFAYNEDRDEVMLFQNFTRGRVIQPGRYVFLQDGTFRAPKSAALSLDVRLSAVYMPGTEALYFRSFRTVNTFLPLEEHFEEAADQEIREVLNHDRLKSEDTEQVLSFSNQWFRRRFAMLRQSDVLDQYSAQEILEHSRGYEVDVQLRGDRVVFPANRADAKRLLQFFNEEIFRGAITDTLYETNSKRQAG